MPLFNQNNFVETSSAPYQAIQTCSFTVKKFFHLAADSLGCFYNIPQAPQNSNEATLQRTGGSSFGYTQAAHNITENGISPPTRRTISANNENMTTGEVEDTSEANGHVDSFLELLRSST